MSAPVLLLALILAPAALQGEVVETYGDGTVRARYSVDAEGRRHGPCVEYWPSGRTRLKCRYAHEVLAGRFESFHESGARDVEASYRTGVLHGRYEQRAADGTPLVEGRYAYGAKDGEFVHRRGGELVSRQEWDGGALVLLDGIVPHPRPAAEIAAALERIESAPPALVLRTEQEGDVTPALAAGRARALKRLQAYRYLSGVPFEDLAHDADFDFHCSAAARLLVALGRLEHTPPNPGLPEQEYRDGYEGTENSNLSLGRGDIAAAIDGFMDDSDQSNIERVGHRRWCLNPAMLRTGFGAQGAFVAMWATDTSRPRVPDWETIAYPAPGWYPAELFGARRAWSVRFSPDHFGELDPAAIQVRVVPLDADYLPSGEPLALDHLGASNGQVVFRPAEIDTSPGRRYRVAIIGIEGRQHADRLEYVVEFFRLEAAGDESAGGEDARDGRARDGDARAD